MDRINAKPIGESDYKPFKRDSLPGSERIVCLRESDGQLLWTREYDCTYTTATLYAIGPRVTPAVHDGLVYALGAEGNFHCLKTSDGAIAWSRDFKKDYDLKIPTWGTSSHPLIDGNKVICVVGGEGSVAVAFDRKTGKELWRSLAAKEPGYAPPVIYTIDGERHLLIWHSEAICGLNPETGEVLWSVKAEPTYAMSISTPRLHGRQIYLAGYRHHSWLVEIGTERRSAHVIWKGDRERGIAAVFNTPFIEQGLVYGCNNDGFYMCARLKQGEVLWKTLEPLQSKRRLDWGNVYTVKYQDRFFLATDKGDLIIAKLSDKGYHEISRANLIKPTHQIGGRVVVWSHPSFANRSIYLRNDHEIRCYSLAGE